MINTLMGHAVSCCYPPDRADNVIEFIAGNHIKENFALINLSLNFCEMTIYDKVFLNNLIAVH